MFFNVGIKKKLGSLHLSSSALLIHISLVTVFLLSLVFPSFIFGASSKKFTIINIVTDCTGVLSAPERKELRILSDEIAQETGLRILYLMVDRESSLQSLQSESVEESAAELCREWKFRKKRKNPILILYIAKENKLVMDTSFVPGGEISKEMKEILFSSVFSPRYSSGDYFNAFFRLGEALYGVVEDDPAILNLIKTDTYNSKGSDLDAEMSSRALRGIIGFLFFILSLVTSGLFILEGRRSLFGEKPSGLIKKITTGIPGFIISFLFGVLCYGFLFGITLVDPRWWGLALLGVLFSLFEIGIITLLVKVLFSGMTNELAGNREAQVPLYAGLRRKNRDVSDSGIANFSGGW